MHLRIGDGACIIKYTLSILPFVVSFEDLHPESLCVYQQSILMEMVAWSVPCWQHYVWCKCRWNATSNPDSQLVMLHWWHPPWGEWMDRNTSNVKKYLYYSNGELYSRIVKAWSFMIAYSFTISHWQIEVRGESTLTKVLCHQICQESKLILIIL